MYAWQPLLQVNGVVLSKSAQDLTLNQRREKEDATQGMGGAGLRAVAKGADVAKALEKAATKQRRRKANRKMRQSRKANPRQKQKRKQKGRRRQRGRLPQNPSPLQG